ncbi:MAG: ATP-binding protein [Spirochaetes bacterium]|nr:ATP-binding protein [Spirochaetota bacterium]
MAIGCIYVTDERQAWFDFSESYLEGGLALVVPAHSSIDTVYDLDHMTLGVKKDASGDKYATKLVEQGYNITTIRFDDTFDSFAALAGGKLDAVLNDYLNSVYLLNKYFSGSIKITKGTWTDIVYDRKKIAFPVVTHNKILSEIVSDSIRQLKSQNFIDMLYWKWFAIMPPPDIPKQIMIYVGIILLTLLFAILVFQLYTRKKRINELQVFESHFRNLIYDLNVGVYILQKNIIVLTNFEGARLAGTDFETIVGKTLDDYFSEYSLAEGVKSQYTSFNALCSDLQYNYTISRAVWKRKDGVSLPVMFRIRPVMWMGQQAVECVVNDTTEITNLLVQQEQLKGQLLQSQKLEIIGQIAGEIAHDFNNVLTVILGYANLLEKSIDDKNRPAIEKIFEAANHAKDIVSKLMTFARKKALQLTEINIHTIIQNAISLLHAALSKKCEVKLFLDAYNPYIVGNATEIQQVFMNLILNAVDAMPYGGTISIYTENTNVVNDKTGMLEIIPAGNYVCITVEDTGSGISPEHMNHIFEPLYTTKEKGSGLGLAIVYGVVKQHKGFIDVTSTPGVGTSFFIYLPVAKTLIKTDSPSNLVPKSSGTIIIIDDDSNICLLYQEALKTGGFTTLSFTDPKQALVYIDNNIKSVKLVLCDVQMQELSGKDVLGYLKNNYPDLDVVMMSGFYDENMKDELMHLGACDVWQKMYDIHEIINKIKGLIDRYDRENIVRS